MTAGTAIGAETQATEGQIKLVVEHENLGDGDFVEARQRRHGLASQVHEGLGLGQENALFCDQARCHDGAKFGALKRQAVTLR